MAEVGSRIPAWKRLGLALKNETQSGVTAPEPTTSQSDLQHQTPYDALHGSHDNVLPPTEPTVNGKPSKLGKRKHQHDAADEDGKTTKKGKQSDIETHAPDVPVIAETTNAEVQTTDPEPSVEPVQPKGDPNYRKKKAKPNKNKRRNHEDASAELALREKQANGDHSALSPDTTVPSKGRRTLLASTEIDEQALAPATTPQRLRGTSKDSRKDTSGSPTAIDRRKSVTFTPDTKRVDGSSGQDLFKKWVADQKGSSTDFSTEPASTSSQSVSESVVSKPATGKKEKRSEKLPAVAAATDKDTNEKLTHNVQNKDSGSDTYAAPTAVAPKPSKSKKKDPSIYTSYLAQYHTDRENWKFNKAKQNDVIDNALNIFRVPNEHREALLEYVQGLKGSGVVERLKGKCEAVLAELDKEDAKDMTMGDPAARQALHDEALQTRLAKEQKRRKVEGDVEALTDHANTDGYIRRLRRSRAEDLLKALGRAQPILPPLSSTVINPLTKSLPPVRDSKKRKRRGGDSSDESSEDSSSDSSSSEDESSSEEESDSEVDSDSDSDSDASGADSDGNSGSGSDSQSDDDGSEQSDSDSDSD